MFILIGQVSTPLDAGAPIWAQMLLVIMVVGLGVILTLSVRGKIARRNMNRPSPREWIEHIKAVRHRHDDVQAVSAQLVDTARRLGAQLDNKAQRLELLLQEADERIAQLSEAKDAGLSAADDSVVGREGAFGGPDPGPSKPSHDPPRPLDPLTQGVYELADTGRSPLEIAQQMDEQVGKVELILALRDA
ncbi:MAG: hypothetical protein O6933_02295 [Planctomycetota bacterium]|nr:hypothetical protein [Planctomycetota bacterium]